MKKLLLICICMCLPLLSHAELKKVEVSKATASSVEGDHDGCEGPAKYAIDGDPATFWSAKWSDCNNFPITFTIEFAAPSHIDLLRYVPRTGNSNGNWDRVKVEYAVGIFGSKFTTLGEYSLGGSASPYEFSMGEGGVDRVKRVRFTINSGANGYATAAEIEAYYTDNTTQELWQTYFSDPLFSELKPGVTSSEGIEDATLKTLVDNLLTDAEGYRKFRVAEYEAYRDVFSLQRELKTSSPYSQWENPTGIYLKAGEECYVAVSGIGSDRVGLKIGNWLKNENSSTYSLTNGLNKITATTEGNVFVDYYTDNYRTAPNVKVHFVNAPVRGYWDKGTMTNEDWKNMLAPFSAKDSSIIIVRSQHAQLAYPVCSWKRYCPENIDSLMSLYQNVQWAERDMLGLERYGRQTKNRQLFYATTYGFMAATGDGAYCHINSLGAIMTPDAKDFGFWGVGHEWGHNNQIDGFKWSGCGETTNNIYASWAEIMCSAHPYNLRLEDEVSGVNDYSGMRGGRMQTYFEEGLRKGVQWQLQDGPDYHGTKPSTKTVNNYDYDGKYLGIVTTESRNYDHFVKLAPFWQLNLWGILAERCPYIISMVIEGIRNTDDYTSTYNTNGKLQMNFMKLACDSARMNLLPFFEKAGMLRPISAYIEDYGAGWNKISQEMIDNLKAHVAKQGYAEVTDEINYITGHNYTIYRDRLQLEVPKQLGTGCTYANEKVTVQHSAVKNAVAFETYNAAGSLVRITMYGLGSNDAHSFTQVLYPSSEDETEAAAYIMAVGYDGTRKKIFEKSNKVKGMEVGKYYTITNSGRGNALSCGSSTSIDRAGIVDWNVARAARSASMDQIWTVEKDGSNCYILNPQSGMYLPGTADEVITSLVPKNQASTWTIQCVDEVYDEYVFRSNTIKRYLNAHSGITTGYWSGGASDSNSCWTVEEVSSINVTIPSSGYYTACYPMPLELPVGMTAYVIGEVSAHHYGADEYTYAVLDAVPGSLLPAGMPVLLNAKAGKYQLTIHPEAVSPMDMTNMLKGTTLKLTGIGSSTGIYNAGVSTEAGASAMMKSAVARKEIPQNRAYMITTELDGVNSLYLRTRESMSTGIADVEGNGVDAALYDLNGVRIDKPERGHVYVTSSGKKIVVM